MKKNSKFLDRSSFMSVCIIILYVRMSLVDTPITVFGLSCMRICISSAYTVPYVSVYIVSFPLDVDVAMTEFLEN
ncbi:hypothetical protein YC2023_012493 [Brassica napus]